MAITERAMTAMAMTKVVMSEVVMTEVTVARVALIAVVGASVGTSVLNTSHAQYLGNRSLEVVCFDDLSTSEYTEAKKTALDFTLSIYQLMF